MKSELPKAFYLPLDVADDDRDSTRERFSSTPATGGPWSPRAQHGGPPAALLGRALEALEPELTRTPGRFAMDLLGPVPVGPVSVEARVVRPGRSVSLREAVLYDDHADRPVAIARVWAFAVQQSPATPITPPEHAPADGHPLDLPPSWSRGYLDAVEWRWISGSVTTPGRALVWMRPRVPLVAGEEPSPWQRLLCCVDSASGVSAALDPAEWGFLNTELTVHVHRPPVGEWICLDAVTKIGPDGVGLASAEISDPHGTVGRSAQALLVAAPTG